MKKETLIQHTPKQLGTINGIFVLRYTTALQHRSKDNVKAEPWLHIAGRIEFNVPTGIGEQFGLVYIWDTREVVGICKLGRTSELTDTWHTKFASGIVLAKDNLQPLKLTNKVSDAIKETYGTRGLTDVTKALEIINHYMTMTANK